MDAKRRQWREPTKLFINGRWEAPKSERFFETLNPATEEVLARVSEAGAADVDDAVRAARKAFEEGPWSKMVPKERGRLVAKLADLIEQNADELSEIETLDTGMPYGMARYGLIPTAADIMRHSAGWADKVYGETNPVDPAFFSYSLREPVGLCAGIIPWNVPLTMAAMKLGPALALGNVMILKPAEQAPLTCLRFAELVREAGIPDGVINILTGLGPNSTGSFLANHPGIDKVAFTGSSEVGKEIVKSSSGNLKRVSLELGGKSPNIVFSDADIEQALAGAIPAFTAHCGQICFLGTRFFVQQEIYDEFTARLSEMTSGIKVGDPFDKDTQLGPLITREQHERVAGYLKLGVQEGAKLRVGGDAKPKDRGYFVAPTVFSEVKNEMRIAQEEIFGPVATITRFKDEHDAVLQGNDTAFGLAANLWTRDAGRAHRVARALKAGTIWVNCFGFPDAAASFGGYKQSGYGRELGKHVVETYTQLKTVCVKL